ncbi:MAG: chemotaxis protein CheX [Magnetococcales bacterium]|nr:chemotaxis protein CheX [Magnetococcales bacterium]
MSQLKPERCLEVLREAILEIAETMLFVEVGEGSAQEKPAEIASEYSAVIGYGEGIQGSLHLSGSKAAILKLLSAFLGESRDEMDDEMNDAFGEMANLVAGGIQGRLEPELGSISLTPPEVASGRINHRAAGAVPACVSHLFDLDGEIFSVEVFY